MYTNYIFDLYGTLIDINTDEESMDFWYKLSLFYSFKGALYNAEELRESYRALVKLNLDNLMDSKYPDFPLETVFSKLYTNKNILPSDELIMDTAHFFRTSSIKYIKLYDSVIELLELLKKKGKKIYLLSNAQRIFTLYEMRLLGIEKYFDDILCVEDVKNAKPSGEGILKLLEKYNLSKNEALMIGDSDADYFASVDANISCYLACWGLKKFQSNIKPLKFVTSYNDIAEELINYE